MNRWAIIGRPYGTEHDPLLRDPDPATSRWAIAKRSYGSKSWRLVLVIKTLIFQNYPPTFSIRRAREEFRQRASYR